MKLYKLTFADLSVGKVVRFRSSKLAAGRLVTDWKTEFPLRSLVLNERVDVPETKQAFVDWLNQNEGSDNGQ